MFTPLVEKTFKLSSYKNDLNEVKIDLQEKCNEKKLSSLNYKFDLTRVSEFGGDPNIKREKESMQH